MQNDGLAIIIVTCDRPELLRECIISCKVDAGYDRGEDHIFTVNDKSPSLSVTKPTLLLSVLDDVTTINHCKPYYALASARNAGIEAALLAGYKRGLFLDDDMSLEKRCLTAHKGAFNGGHVLYRGMVASERSCGDDAFLGDFLKRLPETETIDANSRHGLEHDLLLRILRFGGITNTCLDLDALSDAGGFNERFDGGWGYEDTELINRLILRDGWSVRFVRDAGACHAAAKPANDSYSREDFTKNRRLFQKLVRGYRRE